MSSLSQTFFGRKEYRIDPKGRIPCPTSWYSLLDLAENNVIVIAKDFNESGNYLEIFSLKMWHEREAVIDEMDEDADKEDLLLNYVGTAMPVELDAQNRIRVPKHLADYAGIDRDVVFVGAIKTLRIWSKSKLQEYESREKNSAEDIGRRREKMNAAKRRIVERGGNK